MTSKFCLHAKEILQTQTHISHLVIFAFICVFCFSVPPQILHRSLNQVTGFFLVSLCTNILKITFDMYQVTNNQYNEHLDLGK